MKKVLGIIGSKRKLGNCEIMIKEISRQIKDPHQLNLLRLPDLDLHYCTACYRCLTKGSECILKDNLSIALQAIIEADALILAVPTYFLGAHSCLKVFSDRALSFYSISEKLWGKPAVGVGIAGQSGMEGSTLLDIEKFFAVIFAKNHSSRIVYGALPGEVVLNKENRQHAVELASSLFTPPSPKAVMCCPVCRGETFRFLESNQLRCMLCSDTFDMVKIDSNFSIKSRKTSSGFLATETEAVKHRDWLLGMLDRYKNLKKALKEITIEYKDEGNRIV